MSRPTPAFTTFASEMIGISFASALVIFSRVFRHAEKATVGMVPLVYLLLSLTGERNLAGAVILVGAPILAGALIWSEVLICAALLICVLNINSSAMEATPAKAVNDLFMVFSLECAGSSVRCSVVMREYAGQE